MTLLQEILSICPAELVESREHGKIAELVSQGRTQPSNVEIGNGTILEVLGLASGNAMLDVIYSQPDFRHVKPLLEQGRLVISSPLVAATVQSMAANGVISQDEANRLLALGQRPAPVSVSEVIEAMKGI